MNGSEKNPMGKWLLNQISSSVPKDYLHPCPYFGYMKWNYTPKATKGALFLLKGLYQISYQIFNDEDSNIFTMKVQGNLQ